MTDKSDLSRSHEDVEAHQHAHRVREQGPLHGLWTTCNVDTPPAVLQDVMVAGRKE